MNDFDEIRKAVTMSFMNNPLKISACLIIVSATLIMVGCTSTEKSWYKPNMNQDSWVIDSASCHSRADKLAEKNAALLPTVSNSGVDNVKGYKKLMEHHGAKKYSEMIYRQCMVNKGYQLITPKPKPGQQA